MKPAINKFLSPSGSEEGTRCENFIETHVAYPHLKAGNNSWSCYPEASTSNSYFTTSVINSDAIQRRVNLKCWEVVYYFILITGFLSQGLSLCLSNFK